MNIKLIKAFPFFLIIYELAVNLSNDMYLPALSEMGNFFNTTNNQIQYTLTAWFAGAMAMNPVLGSLSDNIGRKKILLWSGAIFLIATLYCAYPANFSLFLCARFLQGMAVTSIVVGGYALIHELYSDEDAILIVAWMNGCLIVAPMMGPLLGGAIMHVSSWHYIFLTLCLISATALIGLHFFMPAIKFAETSSETFNFKNEVSIYSKILSSPKFLLGAVIYSLFFAGLIAWITISPFLLLSRYHYSPLQFGLIQIPIFASYILGILLLKLALKFQLSEETIISRGMSILVFTSICAFGMVLSDNINLFSLMAILCVFTMSYGFIAAPLNRFTITSLPFGMGKMMAMFDLILGIFATAATMIVNVNADNPANYTAIFIASIPLLALPFYLIKYKCLSGNLTHEYSTTK